MSLFDAMDMGMSGMNAGAALVGNAGTSLGNMFSQNLEAARANAAHGAGGGHHSGMQMGSSTQGNSAAIKGEIGQAMCDVDPTSELGMMVQGQEMYDANAQVVGAADQAVGTLLDVVNGP